MNNITDVVNLLDKGIADTIVSAPNSSIDMANTNGTSIPQSILIIQGSIASLGIKCKLTVIAVFLNHKKLRLKIPNIFIINQVRTKNTQLLENKHSVSFRV